METKELRCTCTHRAQDDTYGGMRVHNLTRQGEKSGMKTWRCSVCGATRTSGVNTQRKEAP